MVRSIGITWHLTAHVLLCHQDQKMEFAGVVYVPIVDKHAP